MTSVMCGRSEATIPGTEGGEGAGGPPAGCCSQRDRLSSRLAIHNSISRGTAWNCTDTTIQTSKWLLLPASRPLQTRGATRA